MKILYCSPGVDIEDLKRQPNAFTASKIKTLQAKKRPYFIKEFQSVRNMEYLELKPAPHFAKLWSDMMNKRTFSYNFKYFNSKAILDEYIEYNQDVANLVNSCCSPNSLVIVNDESLYLLPGMVNCRVAVRNLKFNKSFIERVPYYTQILQGLFKAQKFFADRDSLEAFNCYVDSSYEFWDKDRGGCWYMKTPVNKDRVRLVLQMCIQGGCCEDESNCNGKQTGCNSKQAACIPQNLQTNLSKEQTEELYKKVRDYIQNLPRVQQKSSQIVLTNAPLLHLEAYIKGTEGANIRYLRDRLEVDEEQERMIQYLRKSYDCTIEVVDTYDFDVIVLEMLHCDVFLGNKYYELARILRRQHVFDSFDPAEVKSDLEGCIGKMRQREQVHGEDEYLKDFMEINGYRIQPSEVESYDDAIDAMVMKYLSGKCESEKCGKAVNMPEEMPDEGEIRECDCLECKCARGVIYEKVVEGKKVLFKRVCGSSKGCKKSGCVVVEIDEKNGSCNGISKDDCKTQHCGKNSDDERNCYCNNGKHYDDGKGTVCNCGKRRAPRKTRQTPAIKDETPRKAPQADFEDIKRKWEKTGKVALLDYDGTLIKMFPTPGEAQPTEYLIDLIKRLSENGQKCVICTGRSCKDVDAWFPPEIEVYAEHGAHHRINGKWKTSRAIDRLGECREIMQFYADKTPGAIVEEKESACAFHYKNVPGFDVSQLFSLLKRIVGDSVYLGKDSVEVRSGSKDAVVHEVKPDLCAGDDRTDEDMFAYCEGISLKVGEGDTIADYSIKDVDDMVSLLEYLLK